MADFKNEYACLCKLYETILESPPEQVYDVPGDVEDLKEKLIDLVFERCKDKDIMLILDD